MNKRLSEIAVRVERATAPMPQGDCTKPSRWTGISCDCDWCAKYIPWRAAEKEFIAHAREDVPYLLALVEKKNAALTQAWHCLHGSCDCKAGEHMKRLEDGMDAALEQE